jgi:hypothetical protein
MSVYDYLFLDLNGGIAGRTAFRRGLGAEPSSLWRAPPAIFVAQLGWSGAEIAVLLARGDDDAAARGAALRAAAAPEVAACAHFVLTPTLRPRTGEALRPGGIYVHRWFDVAAASLGEFIALSGEAWPDFESRFDANIFGLFEAAAAAGAQAEVQSGERRLLLITRYASHGVWEASRDPSTAAMRTFARRAALTRRTRAASALLLPV